MTKMVSHTNELENKNIISRLCNTNNGMNVYCSVFYLLFPINK